MPRDIVEKSVSAGTAFLAYLCKVGIIKSDDDDKVEECGVSGILSEDYFGIPKGYRVYISMFKNKSLYIVYASQEDVEGINEDDEPWWCSWYCENGYHPLVKHKKVKLFLTFQEYQPISNVDQDDYIDYSVDISKLKLWELA